MWIKFQLLRLIKNVRFFAYKDADIPPYRLDGQLYYVPDRVDPNGPMFLQHMGSLLGIVGGGGTGGQGTIYISDITGRSGVVVSAKTYQDSNSNVLQSCTASGGTISVKVRASYPLVSVEGVAANLPRVGDIFEGTVDLTLVASKAIQATVTTPNGILGSVDGCQVNLDTGPQVLTLHFTGGYPGTQTELKAGDTFQITGTTDKPATGVQILDYGACSLSDLVVSGTSFTVTGTIANRGTTLQALAARVRARNAAGAYGATRDTNVGGGTVDGYDLVNLNNLYPTLSVAGISYPVGQSALKNSEQATVTNSASNYDAILYTDPTGTQLLIYSATTFQASKLVDRVGGTYNISTPNFRISANRAANNATTVVTAVVKIADIAAVVNVNEPAARLRSGGNDGTSAQDHTISIVSDQQLYQAPTLDAGVGGGTWHGAGFVGGPSTWTRALRVHDNDVKGGYNWSNLSAKNLAGIITTTVTGGTDYTLGGFVARTLTFAAFHQDTVLNVAVVDYSKVSAGIFTSTAQPAVRHSPQGDTGDAANQYTILSPLNTKPETLWWNDVAAASANSSGTAQITNVQEAV